MGQCKTIHQAEQVCIIRSGFLGLTDQLGAVSMIVEGIHGSLNVIVILGENVIEGGGHQRRVRSHPLNCAWQRSYSGIRKPFGLTDKHVIRHGLCFEVEHFGNLGTGEFINAAL